MTKKNHQETFFFFFLCFLSLVIFYFSQFERAKAVRGYFERPILSFQRSVYRFKGRLGDSLFFWKGWRQKAEEKALLEAEIRNLSLKAGELSVCLEENEEMRRLLGAPLPASWYFIPAKVVGSYQRLKIDVGEKAGVRIGREVVSGGLLVGRIVSVEKHSSQVAAVTDSSLKIPVVVRSPGERGIKAEGILSERAGERLVLKEVLKSEGVEEGDLVFTSGEGDWLPDLLIGEVEVVEEEKGKVFKRALVSSLIDWEGLRYVFVVKIFGEEG